jgi:REP element-mobilizing transposase RayT
VREYLLPCANLIAYVLMPNHYHLRTQIKDDSLSEAMRALTISYTKAINKQQRRVGVLFQGRFRSLIVEKAKYLVHLSRYIHLNPSKAKLVENAGDMRLKRESVIDMFPSRFILQLQISNLIG